MEEKFPSADWFSDLNPVDCVCVLSLFLKQANFFSTVFSKQFFYHGTLERATSQREFVQLLSNLVSHIKNKNVPANFLFLNTFLQERFF